MRKYLLLVACLGLTACAKVPAPSAAGPRDADGEFATLAQDYIAGYLAWRPLMATALGFHQYDGRISDYSSESVQAELARLKSFEHRLALLNTNCLSSRAFYDYRILQSAVRRELFNFEDLHVYTRNPMTYAGALDLNIYIKRNFAPLPQRVRSLIAILKRTPQIMAAGRANLEPSLPRPQIEVAIEQADGAVAFLKTDLVEALKPLRDTALRTEFEAASLRATEELARFADFLKTEKLPAANNDYALGREKYRKLLACGEMVDLTPERLLELGLRELRHKQEVFAATARQLDASRSAVQVFQALQKAHPSPQTLIPDTARDLESIRQFIVARRLITLPSKVRPLVTPTPEYLRATSFASMDTPGPFETKATEAYYYVTPPEPQWTAEQKEEWLTAFNYYTTDIVSIHEVYPGHYIQFLCLKDSPANQLEKIFTSYAFTEGWAHYAEQMMVDEGFYLVRRPLQSDDPVSSALTASEIRVAPYLLAQTDEALLRVCRFCVSIKMHCQGMTVEEATRFFQDNCYYEQKPAHDEALRGAYDPEYLYYTLGKLEFLKLREDYEKQEGKRFSLRRFHDEALRHGAPPIRLLREVMLKDSGLWAQTL